MQVQKIAGEGLFQENTVHMSCVHLKNRKMLGLIHFCLHFLEFGYVTKIFYVPDFFYFSKKKLKSLSHRKSLYLCFYYIKFKKKANTTESQHFSEKKHRKSLGHRKMFGLYHFLLSFF